MGGTVVARVCGTAPLGISIHLQNAANERQGHPQGSGDRSRSHACSCRSPDEVDFAFGNWSWLLIARSGRRF